ncbi:MAG: iron ABC transporter permease [Cyanobacteria bacterium J06642_12]
MSISQIPQPIRDRMSLSRLGLFSLAALLCASVLLSLAVGSVRIPLADTIRILLGADPPQAQASWHDIIWQFRLPKALASTSAGAALAVSGLLIQTLFRNPLAGPSILGINAGAGLGVALAVLSGGIAEVANFPQMAILGDLGVALAASLGAIAATLVVLAVARQVRDSMTLLIFGVMFGYATTALVTTLLHFSVVEQTQAYLAWTFGSFAGVTWQQLEILLPVVIVGIAIAQTFAKPLNLLLQGENHALSLGLNVRRTRLGIIVSAATLAGCVTAFCGPIAFIGIAVPHLCRSIFQTLDRRLLIPAVTLMGAILALLADVVAQLPGSQAVLPLNAVTALVGAPIVSWLILKQRHVFR